MGQFDRYIERESDPSAPGIRVLSVVLSIVMVIRAIVTRRLEDILTAVLFVVLILPSGVAPKAFRARVAALESRPVLDAVFTFLLMSCAVFELLRFVLDRTPSALIALPVAVIFTVIGLRRHRARQRI
jgi:uncharacterized membrane protein